MSASMASRGGNGGTGTGTAGRKRPRFREEDEGENEGHASSVMAIEEDCGVSRRARKSRQHHHDEHRVEEEEEEEDETTRRHLLRVASELNDVGAALQRLDELNSAADFYRSSLAAAAEADGDGGEGTTPPRGVAAAEEDREGGDGETKEEDGVCYLRQIMDGRERISSLRALIRERGRRRELGDDGREEDGVEEREEDREGGGEGALRLHRTILLGDPLPMEVDVNQRGGEGHDDDTAPSVAAAIAMHNLGVVHCLLGRLDRSSDMFESAVNLLSSTEVEVEATDGSDPRPLAGGPPHLYPVLMNNLGHVYHVRGRVDEATIAFGEALRLVQESLDLLDLEGEEEDGSDQDSCEQGEVRKDGGAVSEEECKYDGTSDQDCSDSSSKGREEGEQVRRDAVVAVGDRHAEAVAAVRRCAATVLYNRGHLHHAAEERDLAAECLVDSLEYAPPKNQSLLLNVVVHLNYIGREFHRIGRTDEALRVYREALAVRPRLIHVVGETPRSQSEPRGGDVNLEGDFEDDHGRETTGSPSSSSSSGTTNTGNGGEGSTLPSEVYSNMLLNVGYIHLRRGRFDVARDAFLGSLRLLRGALGPAHPLVVRLDVHTTRVLARLCGGGNGGGGAGTGSSSSSSESGDDNIAAAA